VSCSRDPAARSDEGCINNARHSRGWVAGHALGWGGQDSTLDPKGSLDAVPRIADASHL
jgi:hypothetical protein